MEISVSIKKYLYIFVHYHIIEVVEGGLQT